MDSSCNVFRFLLIVSHFIPSRKIDDENCFLLSIYRFSSSNIDHKDANRVIPLSGFPYIKKGLLKIMENTAP